MKDIVNYALPFGFIGNIVNKLLVKEKVKSIFNFRREVLDGGFIQRELKKALRSKKNVNKQYRKKN